jgi:hypothetical protein
MDSVTDATFDAGLNSDVPDEREAGSPLLPDAGSSPLLPDAGSGGAGVIALDGSVLEQGLLLIGSVPEASAIDVDPATPLLLTFAESVNAADGAITVFDASGSVESIPSNDPRVAVVGDTVTVDFDGILAPSTVHSFRIDQGAFVGVSGKTLAANLTITFTTADVVTPGAVSAGLLLWLDAAYAPSLVGTVGVELWADRSGRHNNAVQSTMTARPFAQPAAINGKTALQFDGTDDVLLTPRLPLNADYDGFIVWQSGELPGSTTTMLLRSEGALEVTPTHVSPVANRAVSVFAGAQWHSALFRSPSANEATLWNFTYGAVPRAVYARTQGGAAAASVASASAVSATEPFSLAAGDDGSAPLNVAIAELLLFDRVLSAEERALVVSSLREKWAFREPLCAANEVRGSDGTCYFVESAASSWAEASSLCAARGLGWALASPRSAAENDFAATLLSAPSWLGGNDEAAESEWLWANDAVVFFRDGSATDGAFTHWAVAEPAAGGSCTRLLSDGTWQARACDESNPALCQGPGD